MNLVTNSLIVTEECKYQLVCFRKDNWQDFSSVASSCIEKGWLGKYQIIPVARMRLEHGLEPPAFDKSAVASLRSHTNYSSSNFSVALRVRDL